MEPANACGTTGAAAAGPTWDEHQHAWIVSSFYRLLTERFGDRGLDAFKMAAQAYGEGRGRRMALRALADGRPLDLAAYFAYGEYASTDAYFDVTMTDLDGAVYEEVTRCPWAEVFAQRGLKECGSAYCRIIDRAIVHGFNPDLVLDTVTTQHYQGACRFVFHELGGAGADAAVAAVAEGGAAGPAGRPGALERADALERQRGRDVTMSLAYHCAHAFAVFARVTCEAFGAAGEQVVAAVLDEFAAQFGPQMRAELLANARAPFDTVAPCSDGVAPTHVEDGIADER